MALHRAQGRPLWWSCRVGVRALCPYCSALPAPSPGPLPRAPPLLCGPSPVSTGPGREGCWLAQPHFLLARRLRAATGTKGGLCLVLGLLPARPLPPRGPGGDVCVCSQARVLRPSCEGSAHERPQVPAAGPGAREPAACPGPSWPATLPALAARSPEAAARQLRACPAPRPVQTLAITSPRHAAVQPQASPAPPCPVMPMTPHHPAAHPGLPGN